MRSCRSRGAICVRRQLEANGLKPEQAEIDDEALSIIIRGIRERPASAISSARSARCYVMRPYRSPKDSTIGGDRPNDLSAVLGRPASKTRSHAHQRSRRRNRPRLDAGWRRHSVHRSDALPGKGSLILTGQLGDVMRESAQAALTLVKSRARSTRHRSAIFEKSDIHVHVPAGATPKDGPSAGVAMFTALSRCSRAAPSEATQP